MVQTRPVSRWRTAVAIAGALGTSYQAPGTPDTVTATALSAVEIKVEWTAPSSDRTAYGGSGGGDITKYLVEWDTDFNTAPAAASSTVITAGAGSYTIGGRDIMTGVVSTTLSPATEYTVRVSAFTSQSGFGATKTATAVTTAAPLLEGTRKTPVAA